MLRIGITGGIGSGKSVACQYFESQQVPVYYADTMAAFLINTNHEIQVKIVDRFGRKSYTPAGLNKTFIRKQIFQNKEALADLNRITHPYILKHFDDWCKQMRKSNYPFVVKEAALVFESDSYKSLDFIVCMVAPLETRIERVIKRDGKLRKEVLDIINRQWTDDEKIKRSAWVIKNTDDDLLLPQIVALHELIVSKTEFYGN